MSKSGYKVENVELGYVHDATFARVAGRAGCWPAPRVDQAGALVNGRPSDERAQASRSWLGERNRTRTAQRGRACGRCPKAK